MNKFVKVVLLLLLVLLMLAYTFFALLYQFLPVWVLAPVLLIACYWMLGARAKAQRFGAFDIALISIVPVVLSLGIIVRVSGVGSLEQALLVLAYLGIGLFIMVLSYLSMRWLWHIEDKHVAR